MRVFWVLAILLAGCRNHLYVQQEWLDVTFLASTRVGTPDNRQENPPQGQRLLISWYFPRDLYAKKLKLEATVRLWDNSEEHRILPVESRWSQTALDFPDATPDKRILTYRILVAAEDGEVIETWKHPLWTELIRIGE